MRRGAACRRAEREGGGVGNLRRSLCARMMTAAKPGVMSGSGSGSGAAAFHATAVARSVSGGEAQEELHLRQGTRRSPARFSQRAAPTAERANGRSSRARPRSGEVSVFDGVASADMLCSFASPRATPSCSSGTPAVHVPPFALDSETPADRRSVRAHAAPTTNDWWQTSCGTPRVEPRPPTRRHASSAFSPLARSKTSAQAPRRVLPESAAEAPPRRSLAHQLCAARRRRRGGGRERWHQLAAARPHVGEALPRGRGAVGADEARQACGGARRRLLQIAVARPVDARHRRVIEPQGAARAAPQAHRVNHRRRITLLILPAEFSPSAERAEPTRYLCCRAPPRPCFFQSRRDCAPCMANRQPCVEVYP